MIKVVVFDCWGTLFTNSQSPHPFEQFANRLGYTLTDRMFVKLFEQHLMLEPHDNLEIPVKALLEDLHIPLEETIIEELKNILVRSIPTQIAYPDTLDGLASLQKGYKLILLTNTFMQGYDGLRDKFGIDRIFSDVITSFENHKVKPDIQLFKDAIASAGCRPSEIAMVGDNLLDDIEPAQSLGMETILLDRKGRYPDFKNRTTTIGEMEGILTHIQKAQI
jgi:putative hydrolase of the HAD superfamily